MRSFLLALLAVLTMAAPAWSSAELDAFKGLSGELRITGSEVGLAAARMAADEIMASNPQVKVTFTLTGPGAGMRRLRLHQADICLYDRTPDPAAQHDAIVEYVAYGVDPVAIVVNPVNTIESLSAKQVSLIFSAQIKLWSEVGGSAYPAMPIYIENSEVEGKPFSKPGNVSVSSQPAMRFTLSRNKETLGYTSLRELDATMKAIPIDGTTPDLESFKSGKYRIYRVMYAARIRGASPLAQAFLDFMKGTRGQAILDETGYIPLARKPQQESLLPVGEPDKMTDGL